MQLMPDTAKELGVFDAFDPRENILGGSRYLRKLYDEFGSLGMALAAYGNLQALPIGVLNGFHDVVRRSRPHYGAWYAFEIPGNIHGELPAGGLIQKDGSFKLGIIVQWQFLFQQRREFFSIESEDPLIAAA